MLKATLNDAAMRKRAQDFSRLVRHSAVTPRTGHTHKPNLVSKGQMGVTFIGHASFFIQIGGVNLMIDPNFAPWLFVLKRLRKPGLQIRDLPPIDLVLVTHAHFDHLHRPSSCRIMCWTWFQTWGSRMWWNSTGGTITGTGR
jgi:L-ascorbate metabolism protein UlaG (beta-lactamase superfamily)